MHSSVSWSSSRRRFLRGSAVLGSASLAFLAACGGSKQSSTNSGSGSSQPAASGTRAADAATSTPKRGGAAAIEWQLTNSLWDPYRVSTGVVQHYSNIFDTLTTSNPATLAIEPRLIEKWEEVEVGTHYILHVRKGPAWENKAPTNGRPLDAEDVVYNLKYASGLLDPSKAGQIARSSWHRGLQTVTAVDPNTVDMKLSEPNAAILAAMADMRQYVIPREIPDKMPFTDYANFPSMGPFVIREYRDGETARYERNPNYWNTPLPYLDSTTIKWYGDSASMVAGLLSGDVDLVRLSGGKQQTDQVEKSGKDATVYPYPYRSHNALYVNADRIKDPRIWKAFRYLYDYQTANNAVYGKGRWDYTGPLNRVLPGTTPSDKIGQLAGYNPATKDADRKEAASLLKAAGFPDGDGLAVTVFYQSSSGAGFDLTVRFQADIKQLAPKAKFDIQPTPDSASFQRALAARDYQVMGYTIYEALDTRLAAINYKTKESRNYSNYSNPQVDDLVTKSFGQPLTEALKTIHDIEQMLLDESPVVMQTGNYESIGARNRIDGVKAHIGPGSGGSYNDPSLLRKWVWVTQ